MTPAPAERTALLAALAPIVDDMQRRAAPRSAEAESHLAELIYSNCHGRQSAIAVLSAGERLRDALPARDFVARLSNANGGAGPVHESWTITAIEDDGRLAVVLGGLTLWIDPQDGAAIGERARVHFPKEYRNLYPGHYVAIGDADRGELANPLRFYWNVRADGAESLVRSVTAAFNRSKVPFRLKLLSDPAAYLRADAAILYIPGVHREAAPALIREIYAELRAQLRDSVSAFVLELAPGLGLAEDPADGSSFGMHRSLLLASLLYDARDLADPLATLEAALESGGYDPRRLYLNARSRETYDEFLLDGN